jgi:hypothetical protein
MAFCQEDYVANRVHVLRLFRFQPSADCVAPVGRQDMIVFTLMTSFPLHTDPLQATGFVAPAQEDRLPET